MNADDSATTQVKGGSCTHNRTRRSGESAVISLLPACAGSNAGIRWEGELWPDTELQ